MKHKEKDREPILYERYKREHPETGMKPERRHEEEKKERLLLGGAANIVLICILLGMIVLSAIGIITLLQPDMRGMLENVIGRKILL